VHSDTDATPRSVVVEYEGNELVVAELDATLRELMGRLGLELVSPGERPPETVVALARIRIDRDRAKVIVTDGKRSAEPPMQRDLVRTESSALLRETVAHVLLGLVEPLAERDDEIMEPARPAPSPEPLQAPQPRPGRAFSLGGQAGLALLGVAQWGARFAATGALYFDGALRPALALDLQAALPVRLRAQGVTATFVLTGARLRARVEPVRRRRGSLEASLGGGFDIVSLRPDAASAPLLLEQTSVRVQPIFGGALGGRTRLGTKLTLVATLGVDIDLVRRKWWVQEGMTQSVFFETSVLRPYALLGIDWMAVATP
jgi:hypothetical protein